jgi:hypothetical protein
MDFFERLLGFYPDGGTGLLEALYVFAIVNAITIGAVYRARRRGRRTVDVISNYVPLAPLY